MRALLAGALALLAVEGRALAWGDKGHTLTGRVAAQKLPRDVPAFFRDADVELGYLNPDPDRWRDARREPALHAAVDRDHIFKLEQAPEKMPAHRYEFFTLMSTRGVDGHPLEYKDMGFAPYAIAERAEMLTVEWILWRNAPDRTPTERRIKRQIEQTIITTAGVLGHFVTDTGMPLHTSIHGNGWRADLASNPNGYDSKGVHSRFESDYVEQAIELPDFAPLVEAAPRLRGAWLDAAMEHIRASNQHVERLYQLDKAHPFGQGGETAEHKRFTCERLAFSAQALRDFWYTAWVRSGELAHEAARVAADKAAARQKVRDKVKGLAQPASVTRPASR